MLTLHLPACVSQLLVQQLHVVLESLHLPDHLVVASVEGLVARTDVGRGGRILGLVDLMSRL